MRAPACGGKGSTADGAADRRHDGAEFRDELTGDLLDGADLTVIVTDHDVFDHDEVVRRSSRGLDTRNRLAGRTEAHVGRL